MMIEDIQAIIDELAEYNEVMIFDEELVDLPLGLLNSFLAEWGQRHCKTIYVQPDRQRFAMVIKAEDALPPHWAGSTGWNRETQTDHMRGFNVSYTVFDEAMRFTPDDQDEDFLFHPDRPTTSDEARHERMRRTGDWLR